MMLLSEYCENLMQLQIMYQNLKTAQNITWLKLDMTKLTVQMNYFETGA